MPRTKGKYDQPQYIRVLTHQQRKARNAYYFLERLREIDPEFRAKHDELKKRNSAGNLTDQEANKQIWIEIRRAVHRHH